MEAVIYDMAKSFSPEPQKCPKPKAVCDILGLSCEEYIFDAVYAARIKKAYVYLDENSEGCKEKASAYAGKLDIEWNFGNSCNLCNLNIGQDGVLLFCQMKFYDVNLQSAIHCHKSNSADLTVLTLPVQNGKQLWNFNEKAHLYNPCGIYILSKKCFDFLKSTGTLSISENFANCAQAHKMKVCFCDNAAYANSINDVSDYLRCHMDILDDSARFSDRFHRMLYGTLPEKSDESVEISQPSYIGKNVKFGKNVKISHSVIGNNVFIGDGAVIEYSVIQSGAHIGANSRCDGALICHGAKLLGGSTVCKGAAIGEGAKIGKGSKVEENVRVFAKRQLEDYNTALFDVKNRNIALEFDDDSAICGETGTEIDAAVAAKIGKSLAGCGKVIVTGHSGTLCARTLENALSAGALGCGADIWALGECLISELFYAMKMLGADYGIFVQSDSYTKIYAYSKGRDKLSLSEQESCEAAIRYDLAPKVDGAHFGALHDFSSAKELYVKNISSKPVCFPIALATSSHRGAEIIKLLKIDSIASKITFRISNSGTKASAFSVQTGFVSYEKLVLLCVLNMLDNGKIPKLAPNYPKCLERVFKEYSASVYTDPNKCESFFCDGFDLVLTVCDILAKGALTLEQAVAKLPPFAAVQRVVGLTAPLGSVLSRLESFTANHPNISAVPTKSGKTIIMRAESDKYETANELCDICQSIALGCENRRDY